MMMSAGRFDRGAWSDGEVWGLEPHGFARRSSPLDPLLRRAGATMVDEHGAVVATSFGSIPGELALCRRAVGIADRPELVHLELRGEDQRVRQVVQRLTGFPPTPEVARRAEHGWWCPITPHRVLVICEPARADSLADRLGGLTASGTRSSWTDVSSDYEAISVVGPNAEALLRAVGSDDEPTPPPVAGFRSVRLAGCPAHLLREAPTQFLAVTDAAYAVQTWRSLQEAGRDHGLGCIGRDALDRFVISARMLGRQTG